MDKLIEKSKEHILKTYNRFDIIFEKGSGCYLYDTNGKEYLDFVAGIAVNSLGYNDKGLNDTLKNQIDKLFHVSNLYYTKPLIEASEILVENSSFDKVFFCNSGAEAVEGSLKLARMYASKFRGGESKIIAMNDSFHGRTFGAVSVTGQKKYQENLGPMLEDVVHIPFMDIEALKNEIDDNTCAVILEPIQGEGGIKPGSEEYLREVRRLCDEKDIVLIFDEVQCGVGRTGKLFACEYYSVVPDVVAIAKGVAGGIVCGALLVNKEKAPAFEPGNHASTFGGNPIATSAALYTVNKIINEGILENVQNMGALLKDSLNALREKYSFIKEVRGVGLMLGMELTFPVGDIIKEAMDKGLLLVNSGVNVIRFVPPLTISKAEIEKAVTILDDIMKKL